MLNKIKICHFIQKFLYYTVFNVLIIKFKKALEKREILRYTIFSSFVS